MEFSGMLYRKHLPGTGKPDQDWHLQWRRFQVSSYADNFRRPTTVKKRASPKVNGLMRSAQGRPLSGWLLPGPTIILKLDERIARGNGRS